MFFNLSLRVKCRRRWYSNIREPLRFYARLNIWYLALVNVMNLLPRIYKV